MRYALISDIHANLEALDAVLADIDRRGDVDAIYHLGDLVGYSSHPNAVVDRLRDLRTLKDPLDPPPSNLAPEIARLLVGVAATETGTVRVLDAHAIPTARTSATPYGSRIAVPEGYARGAAGA